MSFNLISKYTGYNKEVRHETFCMNLPFITTKITGIDNQLLEKQIKDLCKETTGKESRSIYRKAGDGEGILKVKMLLVFLRETEHTNTYIKNL